MENTEVTYAGLLKLLKNDLYRTFSFIVNEVNDDDKARLIDEAREYYAEVYDVPKEEVFYGRIDLFSCPNPFPYSIVIGDINIRQKRVDMTKLKLVIGDLLADRVKEFPNLEIVYGRADFASVISLPKLKKCCVLDLSGCPITDISSLVEVNKLIVRRTNIEFVNPELEIKGKLYAEDSNNFEEKLDMSKKHDWWYTDNPHIL